MENRSIKTRLGDRNVPESVIGLSQNTQPVRRTVRLNDFCRGMSTGLLITDTAAPPKRVTRDVDAIVQVVSRVEHYQLSEKLRHQGFTEDASEDAPICRWVSENVILDVMSIDKEILGFGNEWYAPAAENTNLIQLPSGKQIKMVSAPYF